MTISPVVSDFFHIHAANAAIATQNVTSVVGASETLKCETSEETVNWIVYSPTRRRISYENQLQPSAIGKYLLDGRDLIVVIVVVLVRNLTDSDKHVGISSDNILHSSCRRRLHYKMMV